MKIMRGFVLVFSVVAMLFESVYAVQEHAYSISYTNLIANIFLILSALGLISILLKTFRPLPRLWLTFVIFLIFWITWAVLSAILQLCIIKNIPIPSYLMYLNPIVFLIGVILFLYGFILVRRMVA